MSDPPTTQPSVEPTEEVLDGEPVIAEVRALEPRRPALPAVAPAVQAVAVAATGFVAGAATVAMVRHRRSRRLAGRGRRRGTAPARPLEVVASRSFLVDVHLLAPRDP